MSTAENIRFLNLVDKKPFEVSFNDPNLKLRTVKNGRYAFVAPAPTDQKNECWKFASAEQVKRYSEARPEAA